MADRPVLQLGDRGTEVALLQIAFAALGFEIADPEGDFGESTDAAVRSFQQSQSLAPNGIVDDQVWSALGSLPFDEPVQLSPDQFPAFARLNAADGDPRSWLSALGIDTNGLFDRDNA